MSAIKYRLWFFYNGFIVLLAFIWRRLLFKTTFIGVTGSVGKTTAKDCIYAVLSSKFPGVKTFKSQSGRRGTPRAILRARPWHRFVVAEVAITEPGIMWRSALLLKPDIAILLHVKQNHIRSFGSLEHIADEKAKLLHGMSRKGIAILNADDPQVVRVAGRLNHPIRWFGTSEESDYRYSDVQANWPEPLSLMLHHSGRTVPVQTQMAGEHWAGSVVAAVVAGHAMGIPLAEAVKPLADLPAWALRPRVPALASGATVLMDRNRGSVDDLDAALKLLSEYSNGRRILISDDGLDLEGSYRHRWRHLASVAAKHCDVCVCFGEKASYGKRRVIEAGLAETQVHAVLSLEQVEVFLARESRPDDLILWR